MKRLIATLAMVLLTGCAGTSTFFPAYTAGLDDYYLADGSIGGPYYAPGSTMLTNLGLYPWWSHDYVVGGGGYPLQPYMYFSPNFYPHYFSIWDVPPYHSYYGFHGFYGAYHPFWCPPYRRHAPHAPRHIAGGSGDSNELPAPPPPPVYRLPVNDNPELWSRIEQLSIRREQMDQSRLGLRSSSFNRSGSGYPSYSRSPAAQPRSSFNSRPASASPVTPSRGFSSPAASRPGSSRSSALDASPRVGLDKH